MLIEKHLLSELHPAKYNPRVDLKPSDLEYQAIKNSIESFGHIEPIIWNKRTGNIVGGHQRYKILKEQGITETEVVVVDFDDAKEKAANLALNKAVGLWSDSKVEELLKELSETEWDMKQFNFDDFDLNTCVQDIEKDKRDDSVNVPKRVNPGDVWILGRHRLICGDSTLPETINKLVNNAQMDLLITDPPYNINLQDTLTGGEREIKNDNMGSSAFAQFLINVFSNCMSVSKPGAPYYVFMAGTPLFETMLALYENKYRVVQILTWVKDHMVLSHTDYQGRCEHVVYGWKEGAHYFKRDRRQDTALNFKDTDFSTLEENDKTAYIKDFVDYAKEYGDVLLMPRTKKNAIHPTMKPVDLIGRLINNSSMPNNNVLDVFGGSGTTLVACEQLQRNAYLVEFEPHYCDCILDRYEQLTGIKAYKEDEHV